MADEVVLVGWCPFNGAGLHPEQNRAGAGTYLPQRWQVHGSDVPPHDAIMMNTIKDSTIIDIAMVMLRTFAGSYAIKKAA